MKNSPNQTPVLEVAGLSISFRQYEIGLRQRDLQVIRDLNVTCHAGEIMAVIGASGSGKSLLAHAILGILPENAKVAGSMRYCGAELTAALQQKLRGKSMVLIPQSVTYLDPLLRVGYQVQTAINDVKSSKAKQALQKKVFERLGLAPEVSELYPFQLSGGMARRVLLAAALVSGAQLVIADEPTPGLDELAVAEALDELRSLADNGTAVVVITHAIDSILRIANRIAIFYAGTTLEIANAKDFAGNGSQLRHPYCQALWSALPQNGFNPVAGFRFSQVTQPQGCPFAEWCAMQSEICRNTTINMRNLRGGQVRCAHAS
jgi:peptide/nickel transport system ATP-binding protein